MPYSFFFITSINPTPMTNYTPPLHPLSPLHFTYQNTLLTSNSLPKYPSLPHAASGNGWLQTVH